MAENATAEESGKTLSNVFVARLQRVSGIVFLSSRDERWSSSVVCKVVLGRKTVFGLARDLLSMNNEERNRPV